MNWREDPFGVVIRRVVPNPTTYQPFLWDTEYDVTAELVLTDMADPTNKHG